MKWLLLPGLAFSALAYSQSFSGHLLPPAPAGLFDKQGACVADQLGSYESCDHVIGFLETADGTAKYVYGARFEGRNDKGKALFRITDDFPVSESPGYGLMYISCESNGVHNDKIVALVQYDLTVARQTKIVFAKRYDLVSERFSDVPAKDVTCTIEGWDA